MSERLKLERVAQIVEELRAITRIPPVAMALLERELERAVAFHTEKCCDPRLSAEESARHREARLLARHLLGFFAKRETALREELQALRRPGGAMRETPGVHRQASPSGPSFPQAPR